MTPPQPPHGQQPGYPQQGYPQPQAYPQQHPGYPHQPAHSQYQQGYPQVYPQHPGQPQSSGTGRVIGLLTAAAAIITGLVVAIDGLDAFRGLVMCLPGGILLIAGGVLLALRLRASPFVLLGGAVLLFGNLVWEIVFGLSTLDPEHGDTIAEALLPFAGIATFVPGLIVAVLAFLPVVRKSLKPRSGGTPPLGPVQFGGHPQQGGYGYPPQQQGYPHQPGGFPQR